MSLVHFFIGLFLDERDLVFFEDRECHLLRSFLEETYESDYDIEDEFNELRSESGSFGMNGTCTGVQSFDLTISKVVEFPYDVFLSVGGGGEVGADFRKSTVDCVPVVIN